MSNTYTVARMVYTPILGAPLTFTGNLPVKLTFEILHSGCTRTQAKKFWEHYGNDVNVCFYRE